MSNKRRTRFSSVAEQERGHSFLRSENQHLKEMNQDLAKALADTKIERQKLMQSILELHDRLYSTDVQRIRFKEFIKALGVDMGAYVQNFFSLTEQMTNMLNKINMVIQPPEALNQFISNPNSTNTSTDSEHSNKTTAVTSMVNGDTILSPKINSARITINQLEEMVNNNTSNDTDELVETYAVEFTDNVSINNEDLSENSLEIDEMQNDRLKTVHEEDEDEQSNLNASQPLLSGVFKDITVYISPMNSQHVTKHKRKSPHKLRHTNFIQSNNSLSSNSPQNTLTQWSDEFSSNSTVNDSNNGTKLKDTIDYTSDDIDHETEMNNDNDPLEGTSSLRTTFNSTPDETSTPYSPNIAVNEPSPVPDRLKTPHRPSRNVCRRKRITSKTKTTSSNLTRCSVKLERISSSTLKAYVSSNSCASPDESSKITYTERSDSPTVLEKSRRSSGLFTNSGQKKNSLESSPSPKIRRTRRNVKPVSYAEPSLTKKLRR